MNVVDFAFNILKYGCELEFKVSKVWKIAFCKVKYNYILEKACETGNIGIIKVMFEFEDVRKLIFSDVHLQTSMCVNACYNNHVNVMKYLYEEVGIDKVFFRYCISDMQYMKAKYDCVECFKYMFEVIKFNMKSFASCWNGICENMYKKGYFEVVKYLLSLFVNMHYFHRRCNSLCRWACKYYDLVKFLVENIGMKENDFDRCIYDNDVAKYLVGVFG